MSSPHPAIDRAAIDEGFRDLWATLDHLPEIEPCRICGHREIVHVHMSLMDRTFFIACRHKGWCTDPHPELVAAIGQWNAQQRRIDQVRRDEEPE